MCSGPCQTSYCPRQDGCRRTLPTGTATTRSTGERSIGLGSGTRSQDCKLGIRACLFRLDEDAGGTARRNASRAPAGTTANSPRRTPTRANPDRSQLDRPQLDGVFKPLSNEEGGGVALATGIPRYNPQIAIRNLATLDYSKALGFDVVADTKVALITPPGERQPKLGLMMERAQGQTHGIHRRTS
jgi:hypothetical protein